MLHVQELAGQIGERLVRHSPNLTATHFTQHAKLLCDCKVIPSVQVSTESIDIAAEYLLRATEKLAQQASHRNDLLVQVH